MCSEVQYDSASVFNVPFSRCVSSTPGKSHRFIVNFRKHPKVGASKPLSIQNVPSRPQLLFLP